MTDTTTPLLGLLLMGTGGDTNAWGTNLNASVITPVENAIAGVTALAITGGAYSLTAADALSAIVTLSGILSSTETLTVPATSKKWTFINNTTGAFSVLLKTATQTTPIQLPQGVATDVVVIATNLAIRLDRRFVGNFFYHAGANAPAGAITCGGGTALIASFPDLYAELGTTWGGNGTTTFGIPNGQDTGRFLRSSASGLAVGTSQANQNLAHTHGVTGAPGSGTLGTDSQGSHTHGVTDPGHAHTASTDATKTAGTGINPGYTTTVSGSLGTVTVNAAVTNISIVAGGAHAHNVTGAPSVGTLATASNGGAEARPEALVGLLCVRY